MSDEARKLGLQGWLGLRDGLLAAFGGVLGYARGQAAAAGDDPATAVHEYRKSVRRARAVVRLFRPLIDDPEYDLLEHELRAALGAASGLRDADVLLATLRGLPLPPRGPAAAAAGRAARALGSRVAALRQGPPAADVLAEGAARLGPLPDLLAAALPRDVRRRDVARGLSRLFRRAGAALKRARREPSDDAIHGWRKRVKELRYALELLDAAAGAGAGRPARATALRQAAARLAEGLGGVTDLIVLRREVLALEAGDGLEPLAALVEERVQAGFRDMLRLSAPLFDGKPRAVADTIVATALPAARGPAADATAPPPLVPPRRTSSLRSRSTPEDPAP